MDIEDLLWAVTNRMGNAAVHGDGAEPMAAVREGLATLDEAQAVRFLAAMDGKLAEMGYTVDEP
jgi:hypothetical protein